jgi:hypothetical protein
MIKNRLKPRFALQRIYQDISEELPSSFAKWAKGKITTNAVPPNQPNDQSLAPGADGIK